VAKRPPIGEDRRVARLIAFLTYAIIAGSIVAVATSPSPPHGAHALDLAALAVGALAPATVGYALLRRRPRLLVAWILLAGAFSVAVVMGCFMLSAVLLTDDRDSRLGAWLLLPSSEWVVLFAWPLALAYVYPDGRLPSPRWRWVARVALASFGVAMALLPFQQTFEGPYGQVDNPLGADLQFLVPLFWAAWFGILFSLFGGALALRARYREYRRQVLWLLYGALLPPLWLGGTSLVARVFGIDFDGDLPVLMIAHVWLAVAVAVAVTRHGLYAIDGLVNRTLVYGLLTASLAAVYVLVALLAGSFADSAFTASVATLAAALLFRPLRDRLQDGMHRRFARARYEGVRLVRAFLDDVRDGRAEPEEIGAALRVALDDDSAEVFFRLPETGAFADRRGHLVALPSDARVHSPIADVGVLVHAPAPRDLLSPLLDAAAVVVELARLRVELRLQLAEVESSRARIAHAGYEERRRIERDLHDGAQQRLVTLGIMLRRLQRSLPGALAPTFDAAVDEVAATIADLRTIAAGVRPPRLDEGLAAALEDLARGAAVPVEVETTGDRAPPEVEAVAYYIACEALTNALKHASPSRVQVRTTRSGDVLRLVVADDGVGGAAVTAGRGLAGMADRVAASGGHLSVASPAGAGTEISVELPLATTVAP
jgi:signal transduction histidine kinase